MPCGWSEITWMWTRCWCHTAYLHVKRSLLSYPDMDSWRCYVDCCTCWVSIFYSPLRNSHQSRAWNLSCPSCSIKTKGENENKQHCKTKKHERAEAVTEIFDISQKPSLQSIELVPVYAHSSLREPSVSINIPPNVSLLDLAIFFSLIVMPLWSWCRGSAALLWLSKYDSMRQGITWVSWKKKTFVILRMGSKIKYASLPN